MSYSLAIGLEFQRLSAGVTGLDAYPTLAMLFPHSDQYGCVFRSQLRLSG